MWGGSYPAMRLPDPLPSVAEAKANPAQTKGKRYRTLARYREQLASAGVEGNLRAGRLHGDCNGVAWEFTFKEQKASNGEMFQWPELRVGKETYADVWFGRYAGKISDGIAKVKHLATGVEAEALGESARIVVESLLS